LRGLPLNFRREFDASHALADPFGESSPFARLYELNSKILLIGVDYSACSILHLAETRSNVCDTVSEGSAILINKSREWVEYTMPAVDSDPFGKIGKKMESEASDLVVNKQIGNSKSKLFCAKPSVDYFEKHFLFNSNNS